MRKHTGQKSILIIFLFVFIPLTSIVSLTLSHHKRNRLLEGVAEEERSLLADLIRQQSTPLQTFVDDYGYWDDLVLFLRRPNARWSAENIAPCLDKFDASAIWIFDAKGKLAYSVFNNPNGVQIPLSENSSIPALFTAKRFRHFFVRTPRGFMEIHGSTIHPTCDSERKTDPLGYLVAGRLWTPDYVSRLSRLWNNRIDVLLKPVDTPDRLKAEKGIITFTYTLKGAEGQSVAEVITSRESALLARADTFMNTHLVLSGLFLFSALIMAALLLASITGPQGNEIAPHHHDESDSRDADGHATGIVSPENCQKDVTSQFLSARSRVIKRADFQMLKSRTMRMERCELGRRAQQRVSELIQSFEPGHDIVRKPSLAGDKIHPPLSGNTDHLVRIPDDENPEANE